MRQGLHTPGVDVTHSWGELLRQVLSRKMDIQKCSGRIAMAGKLGNLMQLPAGAG